MLSLHDEENLVGWRRPTHCFHSPHTFGTQRIEPYTILRRYQVLRQLCLQECQVLSAQEAFKQRILCPSAISQQEFMHLRASLIILPPCEHRVPDPMAVLPVGAVDRATALGSTINRGPTAILRLFVRVRANLGERCSDKSRMKCDLYHLRTLLGSCRRSMVRGKGSGVAWGGPLRLPWWG